MPGSHFDVVTIGAGPAGLAAAAGALRAGCSVAVVDSGDDVGGQYWRHAADKPDAVPNRDEFAALAAVIRTDASYLPGHEVWTVVRDDAGHFVIHTIRDSTELVLTSRALVIATGAVDRQLPFPGWDLPGVYTAGGAQALLKQHGVAVGRRVVVCGAGPFLLPVAAGLASATTKVGGVFEASAAVGWLRRLPHVAGNPRRVREAVQFGYRLAASRVPFRTRHAVVEAHGDDQVEAVTVARIDSNWIPDRATARTVPCDAVAVGWGFSPRIELALDLGCETRHDSDGSAIVAVDDSQRTSVPGLYAAGELCGVGGASLAVAEGQIAGWAAATWCGRRDAPEPRRAVRARPRLRRFATAVNSVYAIQDGWRTWLRPGTVVCRCEEVPLSTLTDATDALGALDGRSAKLLSRAGMGWCQARMCGYAASRLAAPESRRMESDVGLERRPLAVPVPLNVLAQRPEPQLELGEDS